MRRGIRCGRLLLFVYNFIYSACRFLDVSSRPLENCLHVQRSLHFVQSFDPLLGKNRECGTRRLEKGAILPSRGSEEADDYCLPFKKTMCKYHQCRSTTAIASPLRMAVVCSDATRSCSKRYTSLINYEGKIRQLHNERVCTVC